MDLAALFRFLKPTLLAILKRIPTTDPIALALIQMAIYALGKFTVQHTGGGSFSAVGPQSLAGLPPESAWTPEGITAYAQAQLPPPSFE